MPSLYLDQTQPDASENRKNRKNEHKKQRWRNQSPGQKIVFDITFFFGMCFHILYPFIREGVAKCRPFAGSCKFETPS